MNKQKQIEEMARLMCGGCANHGDCKYDICDATLDEAERFYDAGYRIQSELIREIFEKIDEITLKYLDNQEYSTGEMIYDLDKLKEKYMGIM